MTREDARRLQAWLGVEQDGVIGPKTLAALWRRIDGTADIPREPDARQVNEAGLKLMHEFEGLRLKAYPDPGSRDGHPWTIGRGSTGPDIGPGTVWTEAQADARFAQDVAKFAAGVSKAIGDAPTTANQFSAMVSLAYNIGLHAFSGSTLLKKHKAGDYAGAQAAFASWRMNDGKPMAGLVRRRAAEAKLYGTRT